MKAKQYGWAGAALLLMAQLAWADPSAANRIAESKSLKPLTQQVFSSQYQQHTNKKASAEVYQKYLKRWQAAKADGFILDVKTFGHTENS